MEKILAQPSQINKIDWPDLTLTKRFYILYCAIGAFVEKVQETKYNFIRLKVI